MRALFIAPSAYILSGLSVWLDYLLPGLIAKGWDVVLGLVEGRHHKAREYLAQHPYERTVRINNPTGSREGRIRALVHAIDEIGPQIVVSVNIPDTFDAVQRIRSHSKDSHRELWVVMSVHGIQADLCDDIRVYGPGLDAVVCTNRLACRLAVADGGMAEDRVLYAPVGVEVPINPRKHRGERLRILWAGRLDQQEKRVWDAFAIAQTLLGMEVDWEMKIVGAGKEEAPLRLAVKRIPALANRVGFLGFVPGERMSETVYRRTDVLLVTSGSETGPLVLWEAFAHGLPAVSSSYLGSGTEGGLRHETNCLMYPVGDTAAAARCLTRLSDPALRTRLGGNGYNLIGHRYSREVSVQAWHRSLCQVWEKKPKPPPTNLPPALPHSGRLDSLLGNTLAEDLRVMLGRTYVHDSPSEWPHSYGRRGPYDPEFMKFAGRLDMEAGERTHDAVNIAPALSGRDGHVS